MKVVIGKYTIEHSEGFSSKSEAEKYISNLYPELETELVKRHATKLVKKDGFNQSNNVEKEITEGTESGSVLRKGSVRKKQSGKN